MAKVIRHYMAGGKSEDISEAIPFAELQKKVGGWVEVHYLGELCLACDEDGKFKGKEPSIIVRGSVVVGDVYLGKFTEYGMEPVDKSLICSIEQRIILPAL